MNIKKIAYLVCIAHACAENLTAGQGTLSISAKYAKPYDQQCRDAGCPETEKCWNHLKQQHANIPADKAALKQERAPLANYLLWPSNPEKLAEIDGNLANLAGMQHFILTEQAKKNTVIALANKYTLPHDSVELAQTIKEQHYKSDFPFIDYKAMTNDDIDTLNSLGISPNQYPQLSHTVDATRQRIFTSLNSTETLRKTEQDRKAQLNWYHEKAKTEEAKQKAFASSILIQAQQVDATNRLAEQEKARIRAIEQIGYDLKNINWKTAAALSQIDFNALVSSVEKIEDEYQGLREITYDLQDTQRKIRASLETAKKYRENQTRLTQARNDHQKQWDANENLKSENNRLNNELSKLLPLPTDEEVAKLARHLSDIQTKINDANSTYNKYVAEKLTLEKQSKTATEFIKSQATLASLKANLEKRSQENQGLESDISKLQSNVKNPDSIDLSAFETERFDLENKTDKSIQTGQSLLTQIRAMRIAATPKNSSAMTPDKNGQKNSSKN